jgi:GrpB-like predicted nucleotidyltransferase (UPF0157 family)
MPEPRTFAAIDVVNYDPDWVRTFHQLKNRIWPAVSDLAVAIEHVGSTSVPGMAAKPIIDVDIVTASRADLPPVLARLATLGYKHRGNLGIEDREAFVTPGDQPAHHLYVCPQNSLALQNHITVRNYLRTHRSEAKAYGTLKKRLAERHTNERQRYVEGKTQFLLSILEKCRFSASELDSIRRANQM